MAFTIALACAVPVFAASSFDSNDNGDVAGTTVVVNKPSGLAVGDVMIASVLFRGPATTTVTSPGWTQITARTSETGNPDQTLVSFWNEADAADVAATDFTFTLSVGARAFAGIARYDDVVTTGGSPVAAVVTTPTSDGNNNGDPAVASGVTTTAPGQYVYAAFGEGDGDSIATPTGMSALFNRGRTTGVEGRVAAFDVSKAAAGASGPISADLGGNQPWAAHAIALKTEPTKLGFSTSPRTGVVDECLGPITVQTQNSSGTAVNPLSATEVGLVTDNGDTGAGSFFSDSGCTTALTQSDRTVQTNQTGTTFYYKATDRGNGSHVITATATGLTQAQQTETVKLAQTINWPDVLPVSATYGNGFDVGAATATSGLDVTITPSGGCSLAGSTATMTSGTTDCTLTASQAGDSTYAAAPNIQRSVDALKRAIEVTADSGQSKVYSNDSATDPLPFTYSITSGSLATGDAFTGALTRTAGETVAGSPYAINQGTLALNANNYDLTYVSAGFNITKAPLSVNANDRQKTYDPSSADPTLTFGLTGFVSNQNQNTAGVTGTASCSRTAGETVAGSPYTITCAPGTLDAPNYSFVTGTTGNFTINPAPIDVDANPASKTYGDSDPAFSGVLNGFVNGENATSAGVTGAAVCTRPGAGTDEDADVYTGAITCAAGTLSAANYTFGTGNPADFTINTRTAHATFTVADKTYDRTDAASVIGQSLSNRAPGDTAADVDLTGTPGAATFSDSNAGTNKTVTVGAGSLALTGAKIANYTLAIENGAADINPKPVDGSFVAADKVYNGITAATVTSRTVDAADVISPDVVTIVGGSANFNNPNVGNNKPVTLTGASTGGADGANYTVGTIAQDTANITKRNVTGHFTAANKEYDGTTAATITSRSLTNQVPGDAVSLTGGTATFNNPDPGNDKTVTGTGFSLGGSDAPNYNLANVANTTADIQRQPGGNTPPPKDVEKDAENALGGPVVELPFDLNGLGYAFAPADLPTPLKVGTKAIKLFAIGDCDAPCTVKGKETLVLTGIADDASAAAKTQKTKLKTQNLSLAADEFGVIKLKKLTKKQRKAIKKAAKTKLVVKTTLTSNGETVSFKKKYKLKLKK
jgi:YDG domain-containing protein/MBG domain-containing protein